MAHLELSQVTVVVCLHLEVEHGCLYGGGGGHQVLIKQAQNLPAHIVQFLLDHGAVLLDEFDALLVALRHLALRECKFGEGGWKRRALNRVSDEGLQRGRSTAGLARGL